MIQSGDAFAGEVTSATVSPALGSGIALPMLERGHWMPGTELQVDTPIGWVTATVSNLPFTLPAE